MLARLPFPRLRSLPRVLPLLFSNSKVSRDKNTHTHTTKTLKLKRTAPAPFHFRWPLCPYLDRESVPVLLPREVDKDHGDWQWGVCGGCPSLFPSQEEGEGWIKKWVNKMNG